MSGIGPGDLVVCVDAKPADWTHPNWLPRLAKLKEGRAYVVRDISVSRMGRNAGKPTILLVGILNDRCRYGERSYLASRFRKIDKADDQFSETIRACRPIRERQPA